MYLPAASMLISDHYREQNKLLHECDKDYGRRGERWALHVAAVMDEGCFTTALDYGCGKGTLAAALPDRKIFEYDPAIPGKDAEPKPADLVICTDVLEHIEPECLDSVLRHLHSLTKHHLIFEIATRPARKLLPDGRNPHLIQRLPDWWKGEMSKWFNIVRWVNQRNDRLVHGRAIPLDLSARATVRP